MTAIQPRLYSGLRDRLPEQMVYRNHVIDKLRRVFEKYGFEPLETPALEYYDIRQSAQLMLSMPTADRAHHLITQTGAFSTGELASELGLKDDDVSVELTKDERFESVPGIDQNGHKGAVWAITEELGV